MLKKIQEWFYTNKNLDKDGRIYANHVPIESVNYSIIEEPSGQGGVLKNFLHDRLMQYQFEFDTVAPYSSGNNMTNFNYSQFYRDLEAWIYTQNRSRNLPNVEGIQSVEVIRTGYIKAVSENGQKAQYSMSIRITYLEERKLFNDN